LTIQLDDPQKPRLGGEMISGTVIVNCLQDSNCKGLEISTGWSTHGRGNIDRGLGELVVAYKGGWQAGQEYRYPFKLKVAEWPPTYYGTYLNVSHQVVATAKLAWKTDPKVEKEFPVVATSSPADLQPARPQMGGGAKFLVWIVLGVFALIFGLFFWWLFLVGFLVAGAIWFFKFFLPKQLLGPVTCQLEPQRVRPGSALKGVLSFTPRRSVNINSVTCTIACSERCVSGSGSNRTTHTHELLHWKQEFVAERNLPAGETQLFHLEYLIPQNAAPSMKLADNEVTWTAAFRIDIPRWPDWTETLTMIVEPKAYRDDAASVDDASYLSQRTSEDDWFDQVLEQLKQSGDAERLYLVLGAIREHDFMVSLEIDGEMEQDELAGELASLSPEFLPETEGRWFSTYEARREMRVILFSPRSLQPPLEDSLWRGRIGILYYSADDETLYAQMLGEA
jgi:hypothetical protein